MWLTRMRAWRVCCDLCDMEAELDMQDEEDMYNREDETEDAIKDDEEEDAESNDPFNKNRAIVEETMTYKEFKVVNTQYKRLYIAFLAVFCVAFLLPFGLQCYFNIQESRAAATTMTAYLGAGIEPQTHEIVLGKPIFSMVEREHVYYRELRNGQYIMREAFPCLIAKTDTHYAKGKLHQLLERYTEKARYCQYTPIKITILDEYGNVLLEESGEWNIEKCTVERQQNTGTYMVMMH
ncbi:MAG: hypothetical protein PHO41_08205, partial [Eubacteriales bacterium]|nr:hypothetical protein [Eubacteriales bacterium]